MRILVINPGSTSTKIAVFANEQCLWKQVIHHSAEELRPFPRVNDQSAYRIEVILRVLAEKRLKLEELQGVVGRGGMLKPVTGGTYIVDEYLFNELQHPPGGEHASNLGGVIAYKLSEQLDIPAFIVDPVAVDEMEPVARLSGHPLLPRLSQSHALNMKAAGREVARCMGKDYTEVNLVIAHLGGGISVAPHKLGKMIDVNNANNEGPFSVERCGTLPITQLVGLCYSGQYSEDEILVQLLREGGMYAYLGTKDAREAERWMEEGDQQAKLVLEAMCYQVAKEIGAMATVLAGKVDRIVLTGGLSHSRFLTSAITKRVEFIAPVVVIPGEEEMKALALGALRVLTNQEEALIYRA